MGTKVRQLDVPEERWVFRYKTFEKAGYDQALSNMQLDRLQGLKRLFPYLGHRVSSNHTRREHKRLTRRIIRGQKALIVLSNTTSVGDDVDLSRDTAWYNT